MVSHSSRTPLGGRSSDGLFVGQGAAVCVVTPRLQCSLRRLKDAEMSGTPHLHARQPGFVESGLAAAVTVNGKD